MELDSWIVVTFCIIDGDVKTIGRDKPIVSSNLISAVDSAWMDFSNWFEEHNHPMGICHNVSKPTCHDFEESLSQFNKFEFDVGNMKKVYLISSKTIEITPTIVG